MKKRSLDHFITLSRTLIVAVTVFIVFFTLFSSTSVHAAQTAPYKLNFQGRLTDSTGNVKADGHYNMKFRLFSVSSGGSAVWTEIRDVFSGNYVDVKNGLFNVQLGDVTPLSPSVFTSQPLYLEVELPTPGTVTCSGSSCASYTEGAMTPRSVIGSAPYALNADTVDGIDGAALAQLSTSNTFTGSNLFKPSSDSTTAFQIQKSDTTPLLVADTTNLALKVGGGDVSPNASPALLVLDYKNTSGDPGSPVNGAMYYNSNTSKFRCYEGGAWKDCVTTPLNLRNNYFYQNDFTAGTYPTNTTADSSLTLYSYYSGATVTNLPGETNHPGIARINIPASGSNVGGFLSYFGSNPIIFGGGGAWTYLSNVRVSAFASASAVYTFRSGFFDNLGATTETGIVNGCYFRYTYSVNSGNYQGVCRAASVETVCNTVVAPNPANWDILSLTVNAAGTSASFSVNGSTPCTVPSNIPTVATGFGASTYSTSSTVARTMDIDYMEVRGGLSR